MIASIRGKILAKKPQCIVEVGGVGFELFVPERDLAVLEEGMQDVPFFTYLFVREDRLNLFGFLSQEDRRLFLKLIDVSGIGPKIALGMLSANSAEEIVSAIRRSELALLVSMPGLGRRTAERLVMELKDKLEDFVIPVEEPEYAPSIREEVVLALTALGMGRAAVERALEHVEWTEFKEPSVEQVVREALKHVDGY